MTPDLTALEEAAKYALAAGADEIGGIAPSTILSLISTIRSLERERDEARAVIEWADHHYANHDMSHQDFRVEVAQRCADFIEKHASVAANAGAEDQAIKAAKVEAFKAGMMRAAEIVEEAAHKQGRAECCGCGIQHNGQPECCGDPLFMISDRDAAAAIRAEAKGSGG